MFALNSIRKKLLIISISLLIIPGLIIGLAAYTSSKSNLNTAGEDKLKNGVTMGLLLIDSLNAEVESGALTLEEAQEKARVYLIGPKKADGIRDISSEVDLGEHGYFSGYDVDGNDVIHYSDEGDNSWDVTDSNGHFFVQEQIKNAQNGGGLTTYVWNLPNSDRAGEKISYTALDPHWGWVLAAGSYKIDFNKGANQVLVIISITLAIATVIGIAIILLFTNSLTKPIQSLTSNVKRLASGDLTIEQLNIRNKDEIGTLSKDFNVMAVNLKGLIQTMEHSIQQISNSSENMSAISEESTATSEEISAGLNEIARGAVKQAEDAELANTRVIDFTEQLHSVREQTENMISKSEVTTEASNQGLISVNVLRAKSQDANQLTHSVSEVMNSLSEKVKNIESVISVINDISTQTNLLALNASIEAARAGEHGKGFAVVADEVRKLAEQSSEATDQIQHTLQGIVTESNNAAEAMKLNQVITDEQSKAVIDTEEVFQLIATSINEIVSSIDGIRYRVQDMTTHQGDILDSIESIVAVSQQSAASTEEVTAAMEDQVRATTTISSAAEELSQAGDNLEKEVSQFKI